MCPPQLYFFPFLIVYCGGPSLYIAGVKILHDAGIRYHYSKDPIENIAISLTGMSTSVIKIMIILYLI